MNDKKQELYDFGGKVDNNDVTINMTMLRELKEETNNIITDEIFREDNHKDFFFLF